MNANVAHASRERDREDSAPRDVQRVERERHRDQAGEVSAGWSIRTLTPAVSSPRFSAAVSISHRPPSVLSSEESSGPTLLKRRPAMPMSSSEIV